MGLGLSLLICGQALFWSMCYLARNAEYIKDGPDLKSRLADLGFWLSFLGLIILIKG